MVALIAETGPVTERLRVRETGDDQGRRLVRILRRGTESVVTWWRAQLVLLSGCWLGAGTGRAASVRLAG